MAEQSYMYKHFRREFEVDVREITADDKNLLSDLDRRVAENEEEAVKQCATRLLLQLIRYRSNGLNSNATKYLLHLSEYGQPETFQMIGSEDPKGEDITVEQTVNPNIPIEKSRRTVKFGKPENQDERLEKMFVVAFDCNTSSFQCAYSNKAMPLEVMSSHAYVSLRAPTSILLSKTHSVCQIGYTAEETYSNLVEDGKHHDYSFSKRISLRRLGKQIDSQLKLKDENGKEMRATAVFGHLLKSMKDQMSNMFNNRCTGISIDKDCHFILPVPAIWTDSSRNVMWEAAVEAGIPEDSMSFVVEEEAITGCCEAYEGDLKRGPEEVSAISVPGTKFMIINLTDDVMDLVVYERQPNTSLKELYNSSEEWGCMGISEQFNQLLIKMCGAPVFMKSRERDLVGFNDIHNDLYAKCRTASTKDKCIRLPRWLMLTEVYEDDMGNTLGEAIAEYSNGEMSLLADKLQLSIASFTNLLTPCIERITKHMNSAFLLKELTDTGIFVMAGQLASCPIIRHAITEAFPDTICIMPRVPEAAMLTGAVILGHQID